MNILRKINLKRKSFIQVKSSPKFKNLSFSDFTKSLTKEFLNISFEKKFRLRLDIINLQRLSALIFKRKFLTYLKIKNFQFLMKIKIIQNSFISYKIRKEIKLVKASANKIKNFYVKFIKNKKSKYSIMIQKAMRGLY